MTPWQPTKAAHVLVIALKEVGKPYVLGSEGPPEQSLRTWDCSELVQHLLAQVGVEQVTDSNGRVTAIAAFDGAGFQWERSRSITLEEGVKLPGALLFVQSPRAYPTKPHHIGHVAISLGNGHVLEARGKSYGVTIGPVRPSFTLATKVVELYAPAVIGGSVAPEVRDV
jgi:cell wall-associated NlpC family hydrolase